MLRDLQPLLLAPEAGAEALFIAPGTGPAIDAGGILRLDTFANTFYEKYWRDLTHLRTLTLQTVTTGRCSVRMVRRISGRPETVVEALACGTQVQTRLACELTDFSPDNALLHLEIEALDGAAQLHSGSWRTNDPVRNGVRLAIVTCSFSREAMLVDNLRRMSTACAAAEEITNVFVVHQGEQNLAEFAPYRALSEVFGQKLRLIQQRNIGGTGGFTRGMISALEEGASDVLLLDDDIKILPDMLTRLVALLGLLERPTTIGGQMLDLHRPTVLHASHEGVDLPRLRLHNPCKGTDMAARNAADGFARRHDSDYAAWWFCSIPAQTCRAIGLPVPMFIRHDDVEYGVRTKAAGAALVVMPGLFVWHEPFGRRSPLSYTYYERRNFMIAAALHAPVPPWRLAVRHWRETATALRAGRFDYCSTLCQAADDYLKGPEWAFTQLAERHRRIIADQKRLTLLSVVGHRRKSGDRRAPIDRKLSALRRELAFTVLRTSLGLLWGGGRAARAYRARVAEFTSDAYWRRTLQTAARVA